MSNYVIQKGVPIPDGQSGTGKMAALRSLARAEIGDSVFLPGTKPSSINNMVVQAAGPGWYRTRKEGDGYRIWKIAEPRT